MESRPITRKNIVRLVLVLTALTVLAAMLAGLSGTYLWQTARDEEENRFSVPYYQVVVEERFAPPDAWEPGQEVGKEVAFSNTGNMDAYLRVAYLEQWQAQNGAPLSNKFELNGANTDAVVKNWAENWPQHPAATDPLWADGGDGYFYYNRVLRAGEVTPAILASIQLHPEVPVLYSGANYMLEFRVESVVAPTGGAVTQSYLDLVEQYWGKRPLPENNGVRW